ncbi:hypothetical protein Tco_0183488 [Tanacetum coccineum]
MPVVRPKYFVPEEGPPQRLSDATMMMRPAREASQLNLLPSSVARTSGRSYRPSCGKGSLLGDASIGDGHSVRSDVPLMTEATTVTIPTMSPKIREEDIGAVQREVRGGMEHEQLFTEFNVSAARNLSLRLRIKDGLCGVKDESRNLVTRLRAQVSSFEATESSLRGEVASAHDHNVVLEQECTSLQLRVADLESIIAGKDQELSDLGASSSSLRSENQSLLDQVHKLELSSADLRLKLETYEGESFHPHLLNVIAGRRWLLTHGVKLLLVKCLNSNEYMEALGHAFGRAIEKGMQEGLAAGIVAWGRL